MIEFPNTTRVLEEFAARLIQEYQTNIGDHRASGQLQDTMDFEIYTGDTYIGVTLKLQDYWKYLEKGISPSGEYKNPGWKAYPFIEKWIDVKFKLPEPENLRFAYLATRKIVEEGIKPTNLLEKSIEPVYQQFKNAIGDAVVKDVGEHFESIFLLR